MLKIIAETLPTIPFDFTINIPTILTFGGLGIYGLKYGFQIVSALKSIAYLLERVAHHDNEIADHTTEIAVLQNQIIPRIKPRR